MLSECSAPSGLQATSSLDGLTERRMQESLASMRQRTRHGHTIPGLQAENALRQGQRQLLNEAYATGVSRG